MSSDLVIELADFGGRRRLIEDNHYEQEHGEEDEEQVIHSVKDLLLPSDSISSDISPHNGTPPVEQSVLDEHISKAQQKRLKRLFDVSDKGSKGYLTKEELNKLFKKLDAVIPGSDLVKVAHANVADQITFQQFLSIFATVKRSLRNSIQTGEHGIPEQVGAYILKTMSKYQAAKKVAHASSTPRGLKSSSEYDYEAYGERELNNRIILTNSRDHRGLQWAKAGTIIRAALIGAFFAGIAGIAEYYIGKRMHYTGDLEFTAENMNKVMIFWGVVIGVNIVATILEILCLYLDSLLAASSISGLLGLDPWLMGYVTDMNHATSSIVRAAFELPHPSQNVLGIRPLRYSNRLNGCMRALLWKSKRGLTALLLGMMLRRLIPRASMKVASPFLAVPIAALWNSLVAWKVACSIYAIVIGNIAISRVVTQVLEPQWASLTESAKRLVYCVAGVGIALEQQIHPTLETLLRILCRFFGDPPPGLLIDDKFYLQNQLLQHNREEQLLILQLLALCIVSNSHIHLGSMLYLKKVVIACNLNPDEKGLDELRNQLHNKPYIDVEHITDLFRDSVTTDHSRSIWARIALMCKVVSYNLAY